jgi:hypothetical protein
VAQPSIEERLTALEDQLGRLVVSLAGVASAAVLGELETRHAVGLMGDLDVLVKELGGIRRLTQRLEQSRHG